MRLLFRALADVLRTKGAIDEAAFTEAFHRIDLEDGVADGKVTPPEPVPPPPVPAPHRTRPRPSTA